VFSWNFRFSPNGGYAVVPWLLGNPMSNQHISKRLICNLEPRGREFFVWDGALIGFGVRVQTTGAMSYVIKYRA